MAGIVAVTLLLDGQVREVAVDADMPVKELIDCSTAVFHCQRDVVGLRDMERNISYPVSVVAAHPQQFISSVFEVVLAVAEEDPVQDMPTVAGNFSSMTLHEKITTARNSLGLAKMPAVSLYQLLGKFSETSEIITRFEFMTAMHTLGDAPGRNALLSLLFDIFSQGAEFSMISELVNGLSVFCGGSITDKVLNSFALQDSDRDGYISRTDMVRYMRSVFTLLFHISPELSESAGCDAEDLAVKTTNGAFQAMGLKSGELMSFAQYKVWYVTENPNGVQDDEEDEDVESDTESSESSNEMNDDAIDIFFVQDLLGFQQSQATDVVSAFLMFADDYGRLSKEKYYGIFNQLLYNQSSSLDTDSREIIESVKERIFNVYEIAESGYLNIRSLCSGLSLFCGGSWDDKALAVFMAFGITDFLTADIMTQHIISIFAMMSEFDPTFLSVFTAVIVAEDMVETAFRSLPIDPDFGEAVMSRSDFSSWLSSGAHSANNYNGSVPKAQINEEDLVVLTELLETSGSSDEDDDTPPVSRNGFSSSQNATSDETASLIQEELKHAKKTLGLHMFSADDLLDVVGEFSKEGVISASSWDEAILHMLTLGGVPSDQFESALGISRSLFSRLDTPGLGAVDYSSLILSLSGFCNSPLEDRVMVAFTVLDASKGTEIDFDELLRLFRAMFMAATVLSPSLVRVMVQRNLSPDKLAEIILDESLRSLNFTEVNQKYYSLENVTEIAEYCLERLE